MPARSPLALVACLALLCWLLSALGGVHAHSVEAGHGHAPAHDLHSDFDAQHLEHHQQAQEVDAGVGPLLSLSGLAKLLPDLALLLLCLVLLLRLETRSFPLHLRIEPGPPRRRASLQPPLRAPPLPA